MIWFSLPLYLDEVAVLGLFGDFFNEIEVPDLLRISLNLNSSNELLLSDRVDDNSIERIGSVSEPILLLRFQEEELAL